MNLFTLVLNGNIYVFTHLRVNFLFDLKGKAEVKAWFSLFVC